MSTIAGFDHAAAPAEPLSPGAVVADRYRIVSTLGAGAMGAVFLAEHVTLGRRVALKTIHRELLGSAEAVARFEREALASARIDHPNVVAATDVVRLPDGSPGLVLEYVQGRSLAKRIEGDGALEVPQALALLEGLAGALVAAHALGVVHRDLKPDNLLLAERPGMPATLKILDFGIAKVVGDAGAQLAAGAPGTQLGMVYGTPRYMAPEQAMGSAVDARADLYAVGVIAYEMLSGRVPFDGDDLMAIVTKQLTEAPAALPAHVPAGLRALVHRLLAPKPEDRLASAEALAAALRDAGRARAIDAAIPGEPPFVEAATVLAAPSGASAMSAGGGPSLGGVAATHAPARGSTSRRPAVLLAGAAILVVFAGAGVLARSRGEGAPASPIAFLAPKAASAEELARAQAAGRGALEDLAFRYPEDAAIVRALVESAHAEGAPLLVAKHLARLADLAPADAQGFAAVAEGHAAKGDEAASAIVPLLVEKLGPRGLDALVNLAEKKGPARKAAQDALARDDVRARLSPASRVLLDARAAKTCADRRAILARMTSDGDARIAPFVSAWQAERGCGFLGLEDCHPCLRAKEPRAQLESLKAKLSEPAGKDAPR
jgi:serine/threonine-protein kinase